jgi:hypothetical protein
MMAISEKNVVAMLSQETEDERANGLSRWVIVDSASYAAAWPELRSLVNPSAISSLFDDTPFARDEAVAPMLIHLDGVNDSALAHLVKIAVEYPAVVWLKTRMAQKALLDSLRAKLRAEIHNERAVTLRYYDPRVLPVLVQILRPDQQGILGADIDEWLWLDRQAILKSWIPEPHRTSERDDPFFRRVLSLSDAQVNTLLAASFPDRVVNLLVQDNATLLRPFNAPSRHALVVAAITRARTFDLESEFDCATFVTLALQLGPTFEAQNDWAPLLSRVKSKEMTLSDALEQWETHYA